MDQEDEIKGLPFNPMWMGIDPAGPDASFTAMTCCAVGDGVLKLDDIRKAIKSLEENERANQCERMANMAGGLFSPFGAVRVVESPLLTYMHQPNRIHKKRRNQSASYHRRIQKKWNKRFGTTRQRKIYFIDGGERYGVGSALVMHPNHARVLRESGAMMVLHGSLEAMRSRGFDG